MLDASIKAARLNPMLFGAPLPKSEPDLARTLVDQLISAELLDQQAKAKGIAVSDAEIEARLAQTRKQFSTEAEYQLALKANGFTEKEIRDDARRQTAIKKLLEMDLIPKVPMVDDATARQYYETNPAQFTEPEAVHIAHILAIVDADFDAKKKAKAKKTIEKALADAKAGKDFAALAKTMSEDVGSSGDGGDLGWIDPSDWPPELVAAAGKLQKPGDVSGVVETRMGLHVIKLVEKAPARLLPFDDKLKSEIVTFLDHRRQEDAALDYVDALRAKARIQIFL